VEFLPVTHVEHIGIVTRLAREIWNEHYTPIIGAQQVEYMLTNFQSEAAINKQLACGYEYFLIGVKDSDGLIDWVGYFASQDQPGEQRLFISKLYVCAKQRGRGWGKAALEFLTRMARDRGLRTLWLTVNKHNPTLRQYVRWGFVNVGPVVADIGGGYVMDDFKLERQVG
jgi:ribosomal protein S18 acetylase RimI-like enzyme